jgi:hypothetical protein
MQIRIGHPIPDDEYIRETISYSEQRTIRALDMVRGNECSIRMKFILNRKFVPMRNLISIQIIFGLIVYKFLIDLRKQHEQ